MGRGVSSGGGQSSLGYLFGSGEAPKAPAENTAAAVNNVQVVDHSPPKTKSAPEPVDVSKQVPAGINSSTTNGQNTGNFLTVWPCFF